jgi:hypothetical protein
MKKSDRPQVGDIYKNGWNYYYVGAVKKNLYLHIWMDDDGVPSGWYQIETDKLITTIFRGEL